LGPPAKSEPVGRRAAGFSQRAPRNLREAQGREIAFRLPREAGRRGLARPLDADSEVPPQPRIR
jgi:hypothetical protein